MFAPIRIPQPFFFDQIHRSAEKFSELIFHADEIEQAPGGVLVKGDEDIHVAVFPEVRTQDGAEKRELDNFPSPAKPLDLLNG